jgi:radical SAM protein with 4Fe4S-binding SPASM domain
MRKLGIVHFETTTACPARCTFCPHKTMKRQKGLMSQALIEKIIDESLDYGVDELMPFYMGEPFSDSRMIDILRYCRAGIKKRGLQTKVGFYTNLDPLPIETIDCIFDTLSDVLGCFAISFNGMTKESYKKIMGLERFDENLEKVKRIIKLNEALEKPIDLQVGMVYCPELIEEIPLFRETFGKYSAVYRNWNWGGNMGEGEPRTKPCPRILTQMVVLWDGRVCLCCMDAEGEVILGDVNTQTIKEIWEGNEAMRKGHEKLEFDIPLCKNCNMI